jgi:flagellar hook protein FlgE
MMRSLYSGVSGLKTHQTRMDVIGNNIANVNTVAYKSSSMTFSELMYQTTQSASGANAGTGRAGVNAKQIGLGVVGGAITANITTAGATQTTGNPFDIKITGDSFFVVSSGSQNFFTRAGTFYVDGQGNLAMTTNGYTVMGWKEDDANPGTIKKDTVTPLKIMSAENMTSPPEATTEAYITGIIDKNSSNVNTVAGQSINLTFYDNLGYSYIAKYSVSSLDTAGVALAEGSYRMTLEDITTVIQENGKSTTVSLPAYYTALSGAAVDLEDIVTINGGSATAPNAIVLSYSTADGSYLGYTDSGGFNAQTTDDADTPLMTFDTAAYDNFAATIGVSMKTSTMYDNNGTSTVNAVYGDYDGNFAGRKLGEMSGVSIETSGKIFASYDNGTTKLLGQIAVASFANPSGLEKEGENLYSATQNSGVFDGIGKEVDADDGSMSTGVLEMSNVDLSAEFTEMITTQRGFQANSRIITVSDTMIEELVNLKR